MPRSFVRHRLAACLLWMVLWAPPARAWVYPEHRRILLRAIEQLGAADRALLDSLWAAARSGYPERFTLAVIEPGQGRHPVALDYAAWAGLAGDHSCSPQAMLHSILHEPWVLKVADVTARLKADLRKARRPDQTNNAIRDSDIRLQRADPAYATRAGANNVHFLLARTGGRFKAPPTNAPPARRSR
ncbi:MAG: hypothetical protein JNL05_10645 [Flavobacteriales bacterium]|nr:hypothetical protein [Flavobacteriales bacterium]